MPYTPHYLLQYGGTLGTKGEIWSNNIRFHSAADADADPDEVASLTGYAAAVRTLFGTSTAGVGTHCKCTYLKFNKIGADGTYQSSTESNTLFLSGAAIITGAANYSPLPYNVSLAITWRTDFARGRGSKGRIFAPGASFPITSEGVLTAGFNGGIAAAYKTFVQALNAVNPAPGDAMRVVVASAINGAVNPVTGVSVGDVPDTMRSRRNALIEQRAEAAVT